MVELSEGERITLLTRTHIIVCTIRSVRERDQELSSAEKEAPVAAGSGGVLVCEVATEEERVRHSGGL